MSIHNPSPAPTYIKKISFVSIWWVGVRSKEEIFIENVWEGFSESLLCVCCDIIVPSLSPKENFSNS